MMYSFEDMNKFVKNSRKIRYTLLEKLAHGKDWTVESFAVRSNSREDLAEVVYKLGEERSTALDRKGTWRKLCCCEGVSGRTKSKQ
jgi:hypothetical protein